VASGLGRSGCNVELSERSYNAAAAQGSFLYTITAQREGEGEISKGESENSRQPRRVTDT